MLIETVSDGRQSSKDYVPPFDGHPKAHPRCFRGAECTDNHSDKNRPTIPSRSIEFCVVCLRLVSQKPFKPEGFITSTCKLCIKNMSPIFLISLSRAI
jgi:hypothetical protein